ncbi:hypothetical protein D3C86_1142370 [compost metagenome]
MAVAFVDLEIEPIAAALFSAGVLAQREILAVDFGTDVQATEVTFIGGAACGGQGEAVPVRLVLQVDAVRDQFTRGVERGVAACCSRPGCPVLALGAPVEAEFQQIGRKNFLSRSFGVFQVGRGEGGRQTDGAHAGAALDAAGHAEAFRTEAVGVGLVLVGVEVDFLNPGAGFARRRRSIATGQGAGDSIDAAGKGEQGAARVVGQKLLIDLEEAFPVRLVQDRRADQFIVREARVERVIS